MKPKKASLRPAWLVAAPVAFGVLAGLAALGLPLFLAESNGGSQGVWPMAKRPDGSWGIAGPVSPNVAPLDQQNLVWAIHDDRIVRLFGITVAIRERGNIRWEKSPPSAESFAAEAAKVDAQSTWGMYYFTDDRPHPYRFLSVAIPGGDYDRVQWYPRGVALVLGITIPTATLAAFLPLWVWSKKRQRSCLARGLCPACGYDRKGLTSDAARPECGRV